jgi:transposase-like protein
LERKEIMQEFAVQCPNCGQKDIVEAKKKMVSKQAVCRHCHKNTWLRFIGRIVKFGANLQYRKIEFFKD